MNNKLASMRTRLYHVVEGESKEGPPPGLENYVKGIWGDASGLTGFLYPCESYSGGLRGDVSGLTGDVTFLVGDASGLSGDLDSVYPQENRKARLGVTDITWLVA